MITETAVNRGTTHWYKIIHRKFFLHFDLEKNWVSYENYFTRVTCEQFDSSLLTPLFKQKNL